MKARTVIDVGQNFKDYDGAFEGNYVKNQKYILEKNFLSMFLLKIKIFNSSLELTHITVIRLCPVQKYWSEDKVGRQ